MHGAGFSLTQIAAKAAKPSVTKRAGKARS